MKTRAKRKPLVSPGEVHGRLTVQHVEHDGKYWQATSLCSCGNITTARAATLASGESKSCGCLARELASERYTTHGLSKHPAYGCYIGMLSRCTNMDNQDYHHYGGRGIKVCDRWSNPINGVSNFIEDMGQRPAGGEIDRIDNNGNYEPNNCRWATRQQQTRNTRVNHYVEYQGKTHCLSEWEEILGIPAKVLVDRLGKLSWDIDKAMSTPPRPKKIFIVYNNERFETSAVFKASPNHHDRAKRLGLSFYQYCANLFAGSFSVLIQTSGEEYAISPNSIELGEINLNLKTEFVEFCKSEGINV